MQRFLERKVFIRWIDRDGNLRFSGRWLSQVRAFATARCAEGHPGPFEWQLHSRAPWRSLDQANVKRANI
ncbi:MAG TPA: hypothetical protein VJ608_04820 [Albitalea sp.]|nr:hypothetical protein [Albitalea sp.]